MADEQLRSLERRWRETNNVRDEARYLRARLRLGKTSRDAIELAATLAYPAAVAALDKPPALAWSGKARSSTRWLLWANRWLPTLGLEGAARVTLAMARAVTPGPEVIERSVPFEAGSSYIERGTFEVRSLTRAIHDRIFPLLGAKGTLAKTLVAVERWIEKPGKRARSRVLAAYPDPLDDTDFVEWASDASGVPELPLWVYRCAAGIVHRPPDDCMGWALHRAAKALGGERTCADLIMREVGPWLLYS